MCFKQALQAAVPTGGGVNCQSVGSASQPLAAEQGLEGGGAVGAPDGQRGLRAGAGQCAPTAGERNTGSLPRPRIPAPTLQPRPALASVTPCPSPLPKPAATPAPLGDHCPGYRHRLGQQGTSPVVSRAASLSAPHPPPPRHVREQEFAPRATQLWVRPGQLRREKGSR